MRRENEGLTSGSGWNDSSSIALKFDVVFGSRPLDRDYREVSQGLIQQKEDQIIVS